MDVKEKNLTQEEIDEIFLVVNKFRRIKKKELTENEIENLIYRLRSIARPAVIQSVAKRSVESRGVSRGQRR